MFAYCNNNPIRYIDRDGRIPDDYDETDPGYYGMWLGELIADMIAEHDPEACDPNNTNEELVLEAKYFAFYKGVPVIKLPGCHDAAFYFVIFMGSECTMEYDGANIVKHEYGHSRQMQEIGPLNYTFAVAIPSVIGYFSDLSNPDYYSQPYEYTADKFGGVQRSYPYNEGAAETAELYWWMLQHLPKR